MTDCSDVVLKVSISEQLLRVVDTQNQLVFQTDISTATNGIGCFEDSFCTPVGQHEIIAIAGINAPKLTRFIARVPIENRNWQKLNNQILTRVFWLAGLEASVNKGGLVDSRKRKIYIHGIADAKKLGKPLSKGCINVSPKDMLRLESYVMIGTIVDIRR